MGKTRRQREAAEAASRHRTHQRVVWSATACVALVVVAATAAIVARSQTGAAPPPAHTTSAADRNAPAALKYAAAAVGFHTSTEPGVGVLENEPASAAQPSTNPDLLKPGTLAPAFTLKTPQGQTVRLSDFRGKPLLLELFATWCPHCQAEAPHLAKLATELQPKGVAFVSINADSENAASVYAFHRYFGLPYPALLDQGTPTGSFTQQGASGPVTSAYHLRSYPTFYVISPTGRVTFASDGEQPDALLRKELLQARS
jgi:thiol-disulfide isomerase/thioredoxin